MTNLKRFLIPIFSSLFWIAAVTAVAVIIVPRWKQKNDDLQKQVLKIGQEKLELLFNSRLSELRQKMLTLHQEQFVLGQVLNEQSREKIIFYANEGLLGLALEIPPQTTTPANPAERARWDVQKYYFRPESSYRANAKNYLEIFKNSVEKAASSGISLELLDGDQEKVVLLTLIEKDVNGKFFAISAIWKTGFLFPGCKTLGNDFGGFVSSSFIVHESGFVFCHSNSSNPQLMAGMNEFGFFQKIKSNRTPDIQTYDYVGQDGKELRASVHFFPPGSLFLVNEVSKNIFFELPFDEKAAVFVGLAVALGSIFLSFVLWYFLGKNKDQILPSTTAEDKTSLDQIIENSKTDTMAQMVSPTPLESPLKAKPIDPKSNDLKELENALLDMQSTMAFIVGFQREALSLGLGEDFAEFMVKYLGGQSLAVAWFEGAADAPLDLTLKKSNAFHFDSSRVGEVFKFEGTSDFVPSVSLKNRLAHFLGSPSVVLVPVVFQEDLLGILVFAEDEKRNFEILPYLAQICACTLMIRKSYRKRIYA